MICIKCNKNKKRSDFYHGTKSKRVSFCKICFQKYVKERKQYLKYKAVQYKGGKCEICGYNKCRAALDFHHNDPKEKEEGICQMMRKGAAWSRLKLEIDKCILVCNRCHFEIHHLDNELSDRDFKLFEQNKDKLERNSLKNAIRVCKVCKSEFTPRRRYQKYCCRQCSGVGQRRVERPSVEELKEHLSEISFVACGKIYGVSDNTVRNWLKGETCDNW